MADKQNDKNRLIDWMERLKAIWVKRPGLKKTQKALYSAAQQFGFQGVSGDFEHKLRGTRPPGDAFPEILFKAAALDREGLSLEAFKGAAIAWTSNIEALGTSRVRDEIASLVSEGTLLVRLSSRRLPLPPGQTRWRRASGPDDEEIVRLGEEMVLSLRYTGERALLHGYVILLEYMGETEDWQIFTSLEWCALQSSTRVTFIPGEVTGPTGPQSALGLDVDLGIKADRPWPGYELFVLLSPVKFDYRVMARLESVKGRTAIMPHAQISEMIALLIKTQPDLIVGHATYTIR